jgi:Family of unknown function (DUF5670)
MLYPIAVILLVLWLAGLVSGYTMSGFICVLPVIAVSWYWPTSLPGASGHEAK